MSDRQRRFDDPRWNDSQSALGDYSDDTGDDHDAE